jgi:hypothetical protein
LEGGVVECRARDNLMPRWVFINGVDECRFPAAACGCTVMTPLFLIGTASRAGKNQAPARASARFCNPRLMECFVRLSTSTTTLFFSDMIHSALQERESFTF